MYQAMDAATEDTVIKKYYFIIKITINIIKKSLFF